MYNNHSCNSVIICFVKVKLKSNYLSHIWVGVGGWGLRTQLGGIGAHF